MNAPLRPLDSADVDRTREIRGPEIGSALKRDLLLQKVRAARRRLSPAPGAVPKLR